MAVTYFIPAFLKNLPVHGQCVVILNKQKIFVTGCQANNNQSILNQNLQKLWKYLKIILVSRKYTFNLQTPLFLPVYFLVLKLNALNFVNFQTTFCSYLFNSVLRSMFLKRVYLSTYDIRLIWKGRKNRNMLRAKLEIFI